MSESTIKVTFRRCEFASQELGTNDEHLVSRVFFDLEVDGEPHVGLSAVVKQTVGSYYADGVLEVGPPEGYKGPFDHEAFRRAVTWYYLNLVGINGSAIKADRSSSVFIRDCGFTKDATISVPFTVTRPGGW